MFLWRKFAEHHWVKAHEDLLQTHAHGQLVIVHRPGHKRLQLEVICRSRSDSSALLKEFGGRIEPLPRNWLKRFACGDSKSINVGKRLMILRSIDELWRRSVRRSQRSSHQRARPDVPEDSARDQAGAPCDSSLVSIWNWRACHDGNVASSFGTTDPPLEARLVTRRSWDWQRDSRSGGKRFWCRPRHRYRQRCHRDFDGQIKCPTEQDSRRRFSIRRCSQMEPGTEDGCDYGKFVQRFAYRNPAETMRRRMANSLGHFAQPARRIASRTAAKGRRDHQHEASREMDGFSGGPDRHSAEAGPWAGKFLRR